LSSSSASDPDRKWDSVHGADVAVGVGDGVGVGEALGDGVGVGVDV